MNLSDDGLIVSAEDLARIQRQCRERAAELARTGTLGRPMEAPGSPQSGFGAASVQPPVPTTPTEAERFAAAVQGMPAKVRRFFEPEDPDSLWRDRESNADRAERQLREEIDGWCG